jgi:8-oxo-dGTP pyrophosphatase MutT (NUDIX family)
LAALLPEGFRPAPRETTADETGNLQTHERKLKDRVFLMIQNSESNKWYFPTTPVQDDESLLEAAQRALKEQATGGGISGKKKETDHVFDIYYPSNAPIGVSLDVFHDNDNDGNYFGTKTFFLKVQHDEGDIQSKDILKQGVNDFAWLDRSEIVERAQGDDDLSEFYRYLL